MPRLKAAGIHFLISALAVALVIVGSLYFWYPGLQAYAAGLVTLLTILVLVDVILGPALTLIVFKPGKKSLKFDLGVIASIQLAALIFGVASIYQARPVYFAFVIDRFETVSAADLEASSLQDAAPEYQQLTRGGPKWVGVEMPRDKKVHEQVMMAAALHGTGPELLPRYYRPVEELLKDGVKRARPIVDLKQFNPEAVVEAKIAPHQSASVELVFFPLAGRDRDLTVLIDKQTGDIIEVVDLRPWKI